MDAGQEAKPLQLNKDQTVFQANQLVRSPKDDLSLVEAKLIRLAIAQIVKRDSELLTYTCNAKDLAAFLGFDIHNVYREFNHIGDSLLHKAIYMETEHGTNHFSWVTKTGCTYMDGTITISLNPELKPYLIGLDKLFTAYGYELIMTFNTNRAIMLFELLSSYQNLSLRKRPMNDSNSMYVPDFIKLDSDEYIFTMEFLRKYFRCEDKYKITADFLRRVIQDPLATINKNTTMNASFRTVRKGRKIGYVIFRLPAHQATDSEFYRQTKAKLAAMGYGD